MNENLKQSIDLFVGNEDEMAKALLWEHEVYDAVCALEYTAQQKAIDIRRVKEAAKIIDNRIRFLSDLRGTAYYILATQMSLEDDMEAYLEHLSAVYDVIIKGHWVTGPYYVLMAMIIAQHTKGDIEKAKEYIVKAKALYIRMNEIHPWLTNEDDLGFATLLTVSDLDEDVVVKEMEDCFNYLKEEKVASSGVIQSLSHILALKPGNTKEKCDKVIAMNNALKAQNKNFSGSNELCILGILAFLDVDTKTIANEIVEANAYIESKTKAFDFFRLGKEQALMYSGILVVLQHCQEETENASSVAMVIATQIVTLMLLELDVLFTTSIFFALTR